MSTTNLFRPLSLTQAQRPEIVRGTYFVQTWGCQMNEEDSEQIELYLGQIGFEPAPNLQSAHVVILNTCSVRKKPEDKAFSMLGELAELKQARPDMIIGVCGCMAQIRAKEIKRRAPHVDFVIGTAHIAEIPRLVETALVERSFSSVLDLPERRGNIVTEIPQRQVGREPKLKAFVPIQYGCDKFCTYCIVPATRGRERSRPTADILAETAALCANGTREITLLGQTVNSYGKNLAEGRVPFAQLLWKLSEIEGLRRIRYTSPYPRDFKADLIETIRDCEPVMEHVHMPLQSGDDELLQSMKRVYTRESFLEIVNDLRAAMPEIGITTDLIVGFPGETDEQFQNTLDMVRRIRFDGAYMFVYSTRPGTPAAEMEQVPNDVKKARIHELVALQAEITLAKNEECLGRIMEVLVEGHSPKNPHRMQGYSRDFRMMHFDGPAELQGQIVKVRATKAHPWGLSGEIV